MSIPSLSSHLIASARCYRHDYLVMDRRSTATLICDRAARSCFHAGQLVAERDRLGQLARRRVQASSLPTMRCLLTQRRGRLSGAEQPVLARSLLSCGSFGSGIDPVALTV